MTVIDGNEMVLGRIASNIAKKVLLGEKIDVVNAEKIIIMGTKSETFRKYKTRRDMTGKGKPYLGPKFPRTVEGILKRAVRGMLPFKTPRGRDALKRLKVHLGIPKQFEKMEIISIESAKPESVHKFVYLKELSLMLGVEAK